MGTDKRVILVIWSAKLETSDVLQSNKSTNYTGCWDSISVSIGKLRKIIKLSIACSTTGDKN